MKTDVVFQGMQAGRVLGIDTLNGFEQPLDFRQQGRDLIIPDLVVQDYPLMLRLEDVEQLS